jgi:short subunit fatty acids transporter
MERMRWVGMRLTGMRWVFPVINLLLFQFSILIIGYTSLILPILYIALTPHNNNISRTIGDVIFIDDDDDNEQNVDESSKPPVQPQPGGPAVNALAGNFIKKI